QRSMNQRPEWIVWVPPAWFLGLDQVIAGNREPMAVRLAFLSLVGVVGAVSAAVLAYFWSYRRHRVRLLESSASAAESVHSGRLAERWIRDPRELAIFAFVTKTLSRSRQHRLVLTAFAAVALAVISDSFASLALRHGFWVQSRALRLAAVSAPLALSLFMLAGFRYLFRLPVELRANWVFRVNEQGNARILLAGVER